MAGAIAATAEHYSGEKGARRLLDDGYVPEMVEALDGAGTRTTGMRGGMGLLGVLGKYGMYRFNNMLALLDGRIRDVPPEETYGGRNWSNYTWHGYQAPGFPFVHGLQNADVDFNDLRNSRPHVQVGKNLVENKMADSHWFHEIMERGGRTTSRPSTPSGEQGRLRIPVRPQTDAALFLDHQADDRPRLVRRRLREAVHRPSDPGPTDTLTRPGSCRSDRGPREGLRPDGELRRAGPAPEDYERLHDFVADGGPVPITRDEVGVHQKADPELEGRRTSACSTARGSRSRRCRSSLPPAPARLRPRHRDRITSAPATWSSGWPGPVDALARGDPRRRGHQPLVPRDRGEPGLHLPLMLTGNIGKPGAGCQRLGRQLQVGAVPGRPSGAALASTGGSTRTRSRRTWIRPRSRRRSRSSSTRRRGAGVLEPRRRAARGRYTKHGRKVFTGETYMPTHEILWSTNVNLLNNAKHAYDMLFNVNPKIDMIVSQDIEMTSSCEYADVVLAANSWLEFEDLEVTASCSNPFLQVWKSGIKPVYDTKDDMIYHGRVAAALAEETGDERFRDHWAFAFEGKRDVYPKRLLAAWPRPPTMTTTR